MPEKTRCGYDIASEVFVTKDEDPTGLLNEGFRYRDLETGTFITRDPLGFVDGPNVYAYVVQNPWTFFDPQGLSRAGVGKKAIGQRMTASGARAVGGAAVLQTGASFVPGVGEAMDAAVIADPNAAGWEKAVASVSLAVNAMAGGFLPNAGGLLKAGKNLENSLESVDAAADLNKAGNTGADASKAAENVGDANAASKTTSTADATDASAKTTKQLAEEAHQQLDPVAQKFKTTGVAKHEDGTIKMASSDNTVPKPQREWAANNNIEVVNGKGHAEETLINHGNATNNKTTQVDASRKVCKDCEDQMKANKVKTDTEFSGKKSRKRKNDD